MLRRLQASNTLYLQRQQWQASGSVFKIERLRWSGRIGVGFHFPLTVHIISIPDHVLNDPAISLLIPFLKCFESMAVALRM